MQSLLQRKIFLAHKTNTLQCVSVNLLPHKRSVQQTVFFTAIIFLRSHNSSQAPSSLFMVENNYCICCWKLPVIVRFSCRKTRRSAANFQWHNFFDTDKKSIYKFVSRHRSEAGERRTDERPNHLFYKYTFFNERTDLCGRTTNKRRESARN